MGKSEKLVLVSHKHLIFTTSQTWQLRITKGVEAKEIRFCRIMSYHMSERGNEFPDLDAFSAQRPDACE
jgi:hypothetical protein